MQQTSEMQHPGFGAVLRHAWERSRGSISLGIVGVCIVVFVGVAFLDRLGIVTRQNAVSFLGLSYVGKPEERDGVLPGNNSQPVQECYAYEHHNTNADDPE